MHNSTFFTILHYLGLYHCALHFWPVKVLGQFWDGPVLGRASFGVGPVLGRASFGVGPVLGWASFGRASFGYGPVLGLGQFCLGQFWSGQLWGTSYVSWHQKSANAHSYVSKKFTSGYLLNVCQCRRSLQMLLACSLTVRECQISTPSLAFMHCKWTVVLKWTMCSLTARECQISTPSLVFTRCKWTLGLLFTYSAQMLYYISITYITSRIDQSPRLSTECIGR